MNVATLAHAQADAQAVVGNADNGKHKVAMCIGCHGIPGYKSSFPEVYHVPKISGQNAKYIEMALKAYRDGSRKHPSMRGIGGSLTDQDIADVAAFYEASGGKPAGAGKAVPQPSPQVAALLQKGACVSCHGADFSKPIDGNTPKIAGQYGDYLYASLKSYRDDTHRTWGRANPIMAGQARQFSDQELKALSNYLSSLPGELATVPEPRFIR
jgi:cytochrome c553